jgi:hypothetical protein
MIFALWLISLRLLTVNIAFGDALDNWTSHTFPEVSLAGLGYCYPFQSNAAPKLWKVVFHRGAFVAAGTGPCLQDTPTVILRSTDAANWARSTIQGYNGFFGVTVSPDYILAVSMQ